MTIKIDLQNIYTECKYGGPLGRHPGRVAWKRCWLGFDVLFCFDNASPEKWLAYSRQLNFVWILKWFLFPRNGQGKEFYALNFF